MKLMYYVVLVVAVLVVACGPETSNSSSGSTSEATSSQNSDDPEFHLAVIHGATQSPSDAQVAMFGRLLDAAEAVCDQNRRGVADLVVSAQQIAEEENSGAASWELDQWLREVTASIPDESAPMNCAETAAALVLMS